MRKEKGEEREEERENLEGPQVQFEAAGFALETPLVPVMVTDTNTLHSVDGFVTHKALLGGHSESLVFGGRKEYKETDTKKKKKENAVTRLGCFSPPQKPGLFYQLGKILLCFMWRKNGQRDPTPLWAPLFLGGRNIKNNDKKEIDMVL